MQKNPVSRRAPATFDFEGEGDDARAWLDAAFGTSFRMDGDFGTVRHQRSTFGDVAFDHLAVDASFTFDAGPMPVLVVTDVIGGDVEYTRDRRTDRTRDGDSVLASGWNMPFTGSSHGYEIRTTSIGADVVMAAVADVDDDQPWEEVRFTGYVPRSPAAAATWRATVDELSASLPRADSPLASAEAHRLLGHTLVHTFPNTLVSDAGRLDEQRDSRDATPSTVRRAVRIIEARAEHDLSLGELARECHVSPRGLQYAFRQHLGCTPLDYLRRVRLDLARQSLRAGSAGSVSDAAARYGFFNAGRFAREYREMFGENPRQTLLRASP